MISGPEAARYPFFAPLSGYRNEVAIGRSILDFLERAAGVEPTNIPLDISRGSRAARAVVPVLLAHHGLDP